MLNIDELSEELQSIFMQIKNDEIDLRKVKEMNNTAGKITAIAKVQLLYSNIRKEKPNIPFLSNAK